MGSNKLVVTGLLLVAFVVGGIYLFSNSKAENNQEMQKVEEVIEDNDTGTEDSTAEVGSYEKYSPEKIARAEEGDVVLFFRASWCPTCRALDANIRSNLNAIPAGVTILDVDYDNSTALKQKYGVTYQHTFVQVDASGNQIAKWTGSPTLLELLAKIQ
jgi:thioredoxin 1